MICRKSLLHRAVPNLVFPARSCFLFPSARFALCEPSDIMWLPSAHTIRGYVLFVVSSADISCGSGNCGASKPGNRVLWFSRQWKIGPNWLPFWTIQEVLSLSSRCGHELKRHARIGKRIYRLRCTAGAKNRLWRFGCSGNRVGRAFKGSGFGVTNLGLFAARVDAVSEGRKKFVALISWECSRPGQLLRCELWQTLES